MATIKTELQPPPDYRGNTESYCRELNNWAMRFYETLQPLVQQAAQLREDISVLGELTQTVSDPPTQSEVQAVQDKLNAVIAAAA